MLNDVSASSLLCMLVTSLVSHFSPELLSFTASSFTVNEGDGFAKIPVQRLVIPNTNVLLFYLVIRNIDPPSAIGREIIYICRVVTIHYFSTELQSKLTPLINH